MVVKNIQLQCWTVDHYADSVEWCPISPRELYFVCGMYQLKDGNDENAPRELSGNGDLPNEQSGRKNTPLRIGQIQLYKVDENLRALSIQTLLGFATLDLKWCRARVNSKILVAAAIATGDVVIFELLEGDPCALSQVQKKRISRHIILSIGWSDADTAVIKLSASDSNGDVHVYHLAEDLALRKYFSVNAHRFEAWTTIFDTFNDQILFSGGDDNLLKIYDLRDDKMECSKTNNFHTSGVTSLQCNGKYENRICSGSYDGILRLWDTRNMSFPIDKDDVGGGIWRIKYHPFSGEFMLIAAMHNGFHIIQHVSNDKLFSNGAKIDISEHICNNTIPESGGDIATQNGSIAMQRESIAYGADLCHLSPNEISDLTRSSLVTSFAEGNENACLSAMCSFYDKKVSISLINIFHPKDSLH